jgi:hypothetical protein
VPDFIGQAFVFGLVVLFIAVVLAAGGSLLLALGFRTGQGVEPEQLFGIRPISAISITVGSALVTPVVWLVASSAYFVLTGG